MTWKSTRPICAESNPIHSDPGTSARDRAAVHSSTGLSFSAPPDWIWSRVMYGCFPFSTQRKIRLLASNLSFLDQVHNEPHDSSLEGTVRNPQRLHDADSRAAYSEHVNNHSQSVAAMAALKQTVKSLTPDELQLTAEQFNALKIFLNQKINDLAPYYTQMGNLNLLGGEGHRAWKRTCNVTSLSMALEGLGIGPSNFGGDVALLERIGAALEPWRFQQELAEDQRVAKFRAAAQAKAAKPRKGKPPGKVNVASEDDWGQCYSTLADLRMPDFLQHVAVYTVFTDPSVAGKKKKPGRLAPEAAFLKDVLAARNQAAGLILDTGMLVRLAGQFGVEAQNSSFALKAQAHGIKSYGTVNRDLQDWKKKEESYVKSQEKAKKEVDTESPEYQEILSHEQADKDKLADLKSRWSQNVAAYRAQVMKEVAPKLDDGAQVVVNRPGHFMKLHSIETAGLVMDDPWTEGKRHLVSWSEAYEKGYFRSHIVLTR
jgi:hypothetical protein